MMELSGPLKMGKYSKTLFINLKGIIMDCIFISLWTNGKTNGIGGRHLSKDILKLILKRYSLKTLISVIWMEKPRAL